MRDSGILRSLVLASIIHRGLCATYSRTSNLVGQGFMNAFYWQAISDPTNGRVNYVDDATAQRSGLVSVSGNTVTLRADDKAVLSANGPGRDSFRIESNAQYTTHVAIFDIGHMPEGCGTWPAVWEVGANWPNEGELDIIEGVNNESPNESTLHTSAGCTMPNGRDMSGTSTGSNCDVDQTNNMSCGVKLSASDSFGPSFNNNGGGWYAMERTSSAIKIWFWDRYSGSVPSDVKYAGNSINTGAWGTPAAYFPDTDCDFASHLGSHNIVINLTFCGDWAGSSDVYASSGCPSSCVDYVNNNPTAFSNAYFEFNALNIYE
ncbi:glycoside hydrolase family 16 protein [Serpula lacrymans var. lacrymans S7.3]|uniref:Glycoside hydrolase family 16 protein n=2 Tax=Serpula lacrymans var. lacrymans TaxID=341189 RepID=F8PSY0_SERL3|nr:glycoside hydrolase family 16 protein [Serpula lacrymans var. lacrymans S7.9]EGO00838.1 glycoside hydrolase family 16 protein [Serpula lacrymans var. lacrymans S7.3]EGO26461.1 glycoside hydrolase family 16 protein [Serpula lacrymans var. lacrymans S7.9]